MWFQKYRPMNLSECILEHIDNDSRQLLIRSQDASELPNILLHGPAGTGKTSIARVLCDVNRFTVSHFNGSNLGKAQFEEMKDCVVMRSLEYERRCLLIDELDGAKQNAQNALRALMEDGEIASWVCTANDINKIIPPLRSRMILIDCSYALPSKREEHFRGITGRCREILNRENAHVSDEELRQIVELHYPDVRQTINALQVKFSCLKAA